MSGGAGGIGGGGAAGPGRGSGKESLEDVFKRASSSPERFFKELFIKKDQNRPRKSARHLSVFGPWAHADNKVRPPSQARSATPTNEELSIANDKTASKNPLDPSRGVNNSIAGVEGGKNSVVVGNNKAPASLSPKGDKSEPSSSEDVKSSRIMSSAYWGGRYRVCTDPKILRQQLTADSDGDYVRNEVIGRIPISAWVHIIAFSGISAKASLRRVSRGLNEIVNHTILKQLRQLTTLDGEIDLMTLISHPQQSCSEDLWLLKFFNPVQIKLHRRMLITAQLLTEMLNSVCIGDVLSTLRTICENRDLSFSLAKFHETTSDVKRNFDELGRDEWRLSVQPLLAEIVHKCTFSSQRKPSALHRVEVIENSQNKPSIFKKKEEIKCNGSAWDGYDGEYLFTYFEGGNGELWHWPVEGKRSRITTSIKLSNQRPVGAAMGHTKQRLIAYGAQFESHISVMRAHNNDWSIVPKQLDGSSSSSLCEVFSLTGHEGYVASVQFFAQDKFLVSGSGDSSVKVWDLERQHIVRDITSAHTADVLCVSTTKLANHVFLTAGSEGTVFFHDHRVEKPLFSVGKFTSDVGAIKFHQNGLKVVAGSFDGHCCIFDSRKPGPEICEYTVAGTVLGCDFYCSMGDIDEAVMIAEEGNVQVVYDRPDVENYAIARHSDRITSVNASLDSRVAVSSWDGCTSIWMSS